MASASHAILDSKASPGHFGANLLAAQENSVTEAQVLTLIQQVSGTSNPKGACLNFGKQGHWRAQSCPKLKSGKLSSNPNSSGKSSGRPGRPPRRLQGSSWHTTPAAEGGSSTKTVNNKAFKWCAKCNRWLTHDTSTHVSKQAGAVPIAANYSVPDPALWHVSFG